jgi:hypothetical protein
MLLGDTNGISKPTGRGRVDVYPHTELENYLGRYSGLMLYLKEMDESVYAKICGVSEHELCIPIINSTGKGVLLRCERSTWYADEGVISRIWRHDQDW